MKLARHISLLLPLHLLAASNALALNIIHDIDAGQMSNNITGLPPCDALLAANLSSRILLSTSPQYEPTVSSYFSASARLRPWCFFQPHTTAEVSRGIKALYDAGNGAGDWNIAIRSGGHGLPRTNNIDSGVTVDLSLLNSTTYNPDRNTATVSSGARWGKVYAELLQSANVTVTGGRNELVGVGGFLLGGGNSYYTGVNGFGCDTVVDFEVVLANGTVVNANAEQNAELWRALKGGGSNFGLVTRFELEARPAADLALGRRILSLNQSQDVTQAVVDFTERSQEQPDDHMFAFFMHNANVSEETLILLTTANVNGNMNTTAFDGFNQIPAASESWETASLVEAGEGGSLIVEGIKGVQSTLTFLNEQHNLDFAAGLHTEFVAALSESIGSENFMTMMFFQPLPMYFAKIGKNKGGNVLGLEHIPGNAILWILAAGVTSSDDAAVAMAQSALSAASAQMKAYTDEHGSGADWIYANYAGLAQDPLGSYGADNVAFMKEVALKYDPEGFWQERVPGGFKLARVDF